MLAFKQTNHPLKYRLGSFPLVTATLITVMYFPSSQKIRKNKKFRNPHFHMVCLGILLAPLSIAEASIFTNKNGMSNNGASRGSNLITATMSAEMQCVAPHVTLLTDIWQKI